MFQDKLMNVKYLILIIVQAQLHFILNQVIILKAPSFWSLD